MKLNWWKQAVSSVLMLFVISLPAWAQGADKTCHKNHDSLKNCRKVVPEGGASYLYVILSGLAISGGILLRSKRGKSTVYPPEV